MKRIVMYLIEMIAENAISGEYASYQYAVALKLRRGD